ncbi:hypothetical protein [Actinoplanes sp. NPDC049265]|uniref:hypothetical protein n=1 Tax=Actinoplanes sp. NPDC049265 TaxID=3363902 RepID=UPI00371D1A6B
MPVRKGNTTWCVGVSRTSRHRGCVAGRARRSFPDLDKVDRSALTQPDQLIIKSIGCDLRPPGETIFGTCSHGKIGEIFMGKLMRAVAAAATGLAIVAVIPAASSATADKGGKSTSVTVRVEGESGTIFEHIIQTTGHDVTTVAGGTHHCDGTNNGANPRRGATPTSALDDASKAAGFTWDATYSTSFDDFLVTRVGGDAQTATQFWGILVNGALTPVGGCQVVLHRGDEVLFAFDAFAKNQVLSLRGPGTVHAGRTATYVVTDRSTGARVAGASVNGTVTDASGTAKLTFPVPAQVTVKADKANAIRSNAVTTKVVR